MLGYMATSGGNGSAKGLWVELCQAWLASISFRYDLNDSLVSYNFASRSSRTYKVRAVFWLGYVEHGFAETLETKSYCSCRRALVKSAFNLEGCPRAWNRGIHTARPSSVAVAVHKDLPESAHFKQLLFHRFCFHKGNLNLPCVKDSRCFVRSRVEPSCPALLLRRALSKCNRRSFRRLLCPRP